MPFEFSFTADQEAFRDAVRAFLQKEVAPIVGEMDEREEFPRGTVHRMQEEGYFGVPVPEEYGGLGLGKVGYCILLEELGKVDASHGTIVGAHTSLGTTPLLYYGSEAQKKKWLVPAAKGEKLLAYSLTEPGSGSDSGAVHTTAEPDGDGWVLNGTKLYCTNGREADTVIVMAANNVKLGPNGGVTAFLVDTNLPGFRVGRCEKKMGLHGTSTAELILDHVRVGADAVLGEVGKGFHVAMTALDVGRVSLGAASLGGMEAATREAIEFSKNRTQFGLPISEYEVIQFKLADMAMKIHALRFMVYHAAARQDALGHDPTRWSRLERQDKTREAAIVKCLASEWASEVIDEALQIHGGLGYIRGTPIERAYRDARISEIFEGTNEIQRLVVSRDLLARGI
ncbi:MAG: acyl-CoA dehydrogenase family protein [Candidatus Thermoplasmatota archaeon]|jgi:alkylation response protein AidB-like acyl-CoA dehydrogenase|nr:acyl-CoA dehydrogenase family protein [Candidatus Thermoplasmatota archaeon]